MSTAQLGRLAKSGLNGPMVLLLKEEGLAVNRVETNTKRAGGRARPLRGRGRVWKLQNNRLRER